MTRSLRVTSCGVPRAISVPWWNTITRLGQRDDHLHDVLDDDERDAGAVDLPHQLDGRADLGRGEAGHGLVEQQHLGLGGERAGDLEPLAPGRAEALGRRIGDGAEADVIDHLARLVAGGGGAGIAQEGADHHVVQHRHGLERQRHLEGAGDAEARALLRRQAGDVPALEMHGAGGRTEIAGQAVEEGRLAGAVGPDQPEHLALLDGDGGVVDGLEGAEGLGDVARVKQHGAARAAARSRLGCEACAVNRASMPLGRKRAMTTMMAP